MNEIDTFVVVSVILMLLGGLGAIGGGVWQLRRGPVTAREAVYWRHTMRRRHIIDPQEGMPPALTDAFVLAWRRYWAGFWLGGGIGLLIAALADLAIAFVTQSPDIDSRRLENLVFGLTLLPCTYLGSFIGNVWGFGTMRRDARDGQPRGSIGTYRSWVVPTLALAIVAGTGAFALYAAQQVLALPPYTPRFGDYPASPVILVVAPFWLLLIVLVMEITARRIAALPTLATPILSPLAAPYDMRLKSLALAQMYVGFGILMSLACSQLADYPLNVVMGDTFNDHANAVSMLIEASGILYLFVVLAGPHPIRQYREWRAKHRVTAQAS